ncbi:SAM-dependent methyltransferase [Nocardiopsis sp. FIRDI 009]|uniref:SAM-dependent methyltransferase n=1 Tax=Nocardiopsis sp. FIRDI 009 TaxID=714197 RepID=UPI000E253BF2|nr:SAM-dependent methyltransferase [Nocardiopsis sp. FIRDI 009]
MSRFTSPPFLRQAGDKHVRAKPPPVVDLAQPSIARLRSFHLKGKDHFEGDRELATRADQAAPGFQEVVLGERAFLQRAVRYLAEAGVTQFLQFGAGLPAPGDPHEIARESVPDARVVYATDDPMVLTHHRALLRDGRTTTAVHGGLTEPGRVLRDPETRGFLDLDRPVGLLLTGVVPHVSDDEDPAGHIATLRESLAPGSHLVLSHYCRPDRSRYPKDALRADRLEDVFIEGLGSGWWRGHREVEALFDGWEILSPGVLEVQRWHTLPVAPPVPGCYQMPRRNRRLIIGGVGRI